ncbi:LPS export ABC transporter permease LptF [Variovorax sp. PCZ-1]|uniref:LPS export ABC transporter permease LptF n=1 Tax=Variovorax sp. PCZ-1 TaxID=2835533 RepID=UPI001BCE14B9|nr:LPS export ABC transporter permease LptF [Variovorax sp. PCZ-1]MBS7807634.1 LPS export ABC transporter permease LptF [Variovorax sp. PCZ-1]
MLFHSSIRQELARSFVATLVVLITVVMSMMLIRSLGLAAKGSVNPRDVIMLMGYSGLGHLSTIMTLSLFIAVTNTLARMYRESEMAVWFASGKGLTGFISPVMRFAWPILLAIASLALVVWPWTAQQTNQLRSQYEQRGDLDRVSIGQFQENASGSRVFFVEATDRENGQVNPSSQAVTDTQAEILKRQARNIFVSESDDQKQIITSARSGAVDIVNQDQFIVLKNGQRMEQNKDGSQVKVIEFEEYAVLANAAKLTGAREPTAKSLDTLDLLTKPTALNLAELSWRLGLALCAFNLLLLALLLSAVNPRAGRGFGIAFALLAFVVYYNMLNVGFSRIASGRTDFAVWMIALHGSVFALTVGWMALRHNQWSWRMLLPRRTPPTSAL